jgi:hypothetical protein
MDLHSMQSKNHAVTALEAFGFKFDSPDKDYHISIKLNGCFVKKNKIEWLRLPCNQIVL